MEYVVTYALPEDINLLGEIVTIGSPPNSMGVRLDYIGGMQYYNKSNLVWLLETKDCSLGWYPRDWITPNTPPEDNEQETEKERELCAS